MKRITFDPAVQSDILRAKKYFEGQRAGLGEDFLKRVWAQFYYIASYPLTAPRVEQDVRKRGMDKFSFDIFYRVGDEEIFVIAVLHQRRQQDTWKKRI